MACKHIDQRGGPESEQVHSSVTVRRCGRDATRLWSVRVLSVCLTAGVPDGHPFNQITEGPVAVDHPGLVEVWKALVLVLQSETRLVVRCRGSIDTVVEAVLVDGDLGVVGWIHRVNMVTA